MASTNREERFLSATADDAAAADPAAAAAGGTVAPRPDAAAAHPNSLRPSCELYDWVLEMHWHYALEAVSRRPVDARYQDGDSLETPLHLACQNRPPVRLVRALVRADPVAMTTPQREHGHLPIHVACRYNASIDVIRELLEANPATSCLPTKYGQMPVAALWEAREPIRESYNHVFWKKVELLLNYVAVHRGYYCYDSCSGVSSTDSDSDNHQQQQKKNFLLVHAAVSLGSLDCPVEILEHVLRKYPNQVKQSDAHGRYPLHLAVGCVGGNAKAASWKRSYRPRERETISKLLKMFPDAANIPLPLVADDDEGREKKKTPSSKTSTRYPLHAAIVNGHTWGYGASSKSKSLALSQNKTTNTTGGIHLLLQKSPPQILMRRDAVTGLYPFQLAAVGSASTSTSTATASSASAPASSIKDASSASAWATPATPLFAPDLDTVYGLFRSSPDVMLQLTMSSSAAKMKVDNNVDKDETETSTSSERSSSNADGDDGFDEVVDSSGGGGGGGGCNIS